MQGGPVGKFKSKFKPHNLVNVVYPPNSSLIRSYHMNFQWTYTCQKIGSHKCTKATASSSFSAKMMRTMQSKSWTWLNYMGNRFVSTKHQRIKRIWMLVRIFSLVIWIQRWMKNCCTTHSRRSEWFYRPQRYACFTFQLFPPKEKKIKVFSLYVLVDYAWSGDW